MLKNNAGFTLLEVIIAMAIMVLALSSILAIESGSINASARAKQMSIVAMLARNEMIMTEFDIEGKPSMKLKKKRPVNSKHLMRITAGKRSIKEIEFPPINPAAGANPDGSQGRVTTRTTALTSTRWQSSSRTIFQKP